MRKIFAVLFVAVLVFAWGLPVFVYAQNGVTDVGPSGGTEIFKLENPLSCDEIQICLKRLIRGITLLSIPIVTIMVLVGGFQVMTAGANEEQVGKGRKTITYAAIGFVVVILAESVTYLIRDVFK